MKILICGCSFSSGWGFEKGIHDKNIWPNILARNLNAEVTNLSVSGCDNTEIFLNTLVSIQNQKYDKIIVQWTSLDRIFITPKTEHFTMITRENPREDINDNDYTKFYIVFLQLNGMQAHWNRFCKLITVLQPHDNVYFVNGLLNWNQALFDKNTTLTDFANDQFLSSLIQMEGEWIPEPVVHSVKNQVQKFNLEKWVNLFDNLNGMKVDQVSSTDPHPGIKSQQIFAKYITEYFKHK